MQAHQTAAWPRGSRRTIQAHRPVYAAGTGQALRLQTLGGYASSCYQLGSGCGKMSDSWDTPVGELNWIQHTAVVLEAPCRHVHGLNDLVNDLLDLDLGLHHKLLA